MLTYNEILELRNKLEIGEMTIPKAKELYWEDFKDGKRAWHTKDWKERRDEIINDKCQICNSKEILTLQHLSHPKKYFDYENEVTKEFAKIFIDSNPGIDRKEFGEYLEKNYTYEPIPLCPSCQSPHPNKRMRLTPQHLCTNCRLEFDEPISKSVDELISIFFENRQAIEIKDKCFVSNNWNNRNNLSQIKYWFLREKAKIINKESIEKKSFMLYLNENIKYLSFEDTITACKKCAFNYDMNNLEICPNCNENYKGVGYKTCIQCLPEDKRKAAIKKIEFGEEMREMHKRLGID